MTGTTDPAAHDDPRVELLQAVYDRVHSYDDAAPPERIRAELDEALDGTELEVGEETRERIVRHVADGGAREDVADLL